ncbi:hypothetical protein Drorol1_Dr00019340 [Drosera rotundifolia]
MTAIGIICIGGYFPLPLLVALLLGGILSAWNSRKKDPCMLAWIVAVSLGTYGGLSAFAVACIANIPWFILHCETHPEELESRQAPQPCFYSIVILLPGSSRGFICRRQCLHLLQSRFFLLLRLLGSSSPWVVFALDFQIKPPRAIGGVFSAKVRSHQGISSGLLSA